MHNGVFEGKKAKNQPVKILILGESHHISTDSKVTTDKIAGVPASYTTASVILEHIENRKIHGFLTKIAKTFRVSVAEEESFWQGVYFGNYIDVLCGIGNSVAKKQIADNRKEYNNQLFRFVNEHKITKIFCFSILVYKNLPDLRENEEYKCDTVGMRGSRRVFLRQCQYMAGKQHKGTDVTLLRDLDVFGISHPSARGGYSLEMYTAALENEQQFFKSTDVC